MKATYFLLPALFALSPLLADAPAAPAAPASQVQPAVSCEGEEEEANANNTPREETAQTTACLFVRAETAPVTEDEEEANKKPVAPVATQRA